MITPARSPEDILAFMAYALGYWPEDSLVILAARQGQLGPCLRLNLPRRLTHLSVWARAMRQAVERATAGPETEAIFVAVFRGTSEARPSGSATADAEGRASLGVDTFCCDDLTVLSLVAAWRTGLTEGHRVMGAWVVDTTEGRWGTLWGLDHESSGAAGSARDSVSLVRVGSRPAGQQSGGGTWLVEARGDLDGILASPVGVALTVEGHALCEPSAAVTNNRLLPGPLDARCVLGEREAPLRRALRRMEAREDVNARRVWPSIDRELSRLASGYTDAEPRSFILDAMSRVSVEALSALASALVTVAGTHVFLVLTADGLAAAEGLVKAIDVDRTDDAEGAAVGIGIMTGRARRPPVRARLLGARAMLSILELVGDPETQDRARVANAYLSWFTGLSTQACEYLGGVRTPSGAVHAMHCRGMMSRTPIPAWLTPARWADAAE